VKIECILKRKGGTKVNIDDAMYHFAPMADEENSAHVADVRNKAHVSSFLNIPEAYQVYDPDGALIDNRPAPAATTTGPAAGANETITDTDKTGEITGQGEGGGNGGQTTEPDHYEGKSKEELAKLVLERTKKQPHPNAKPETLAKLLRELDAQAVGGASAAA